MKQDNHARLFIVSINILPLEFFLNFFKQMYCWLIYVCVSHRINIMTEINFAVSNFRILDESNYSRSSTMQTRTRTKIDALEVEKHKWNNAFTKINIWDIYVHAVPFRNKKQRETRVLFFNILEAISRTFTLCLCSVEALDISQTLINQLEKTNTALNNRITLFSHIIIFILILE